MATFNIQNQKVTTQYNAETINFDHVHTQDEFIQTLLSLQTELNLNPYLQGGYRV